MQSLAVKYRPKDFESVLGQDMVITILRKQLELEEYPNSYLFCGSSGVGKTTLARILANKINKGLGFPIEIDGASNNGVENVRNLIKEASERSISSEYKVIIIDECHMLTTPAWNAFLKCLEETPKYTIFIFCTTDPQKIPDTIKNRCMRFNLKSIPYNLVKSNLDLICKLEGFTNYSTTTDYIAKISDGCMREAISKLEKIAFLDKNLDNVDVIELFNNIDLHDLCNMLDCIIDGNEVSLLNCLNAYYLKGGNPQKLVDQLFNLGINISKFVLLRDIKTTTLPSYMEERIKNLTNFDNSIGYYSYFNNKLLTIRNQIKNDPLAKFIVELGLVNICRCL